MNPRSSITRRLREDHDPANPPSKKSLIKKALEENCSADDDDAVGFFVCRICLDTAKDPVLTGCGHLFCWRCIYQWISRNSASSEECPVCKGFVLTSRMIPIHGGRSGNNNDDQNPKLKIPPRPTALRVENWKDAFKGVEFSVPRDEMHRQMGRKVELNAILARNIAVASSHVPLGNPNPLLNWMLTSKGLRREQNYVISPNVADVLSLSSLTYSPAGEEPGSNSTFFPGSGSGGADIFSCFPSVRSDFPVNPAGGNPGQEMHFPGVEDATDDFSRLAADMHTDQMPESVVEVSFKTTRRRRSDDGLTVSIVDYEDGRPFRQRRLG